MTHPAILDNLPDPNPQCDVEPLLDIKGVAALLGCSETTTWRLVRAGDLPVIKLGVLTRFAPADVRALIDRQRVVKPGRAA